MSEVSVRTASSATIENFFARNLITEPEYLLARTALKSANDNFTIGYEVEMRYHDTTRPYVPFHVQQSSIIDLSSFSTNCSLKARRIARSIGGYHAHADEMYEASSPPTLHPQAAYIGHLGATRAKLLPGGPIPSDIATLHVSIGHSNQTTNTAYDYLPILRTAESLGASTPSRLTEPNIGGKGYYSFDCHGTLGVNINDTPKKRNKNWIGDHQRIEYRSLIYTSSEQLAVSMDALYYLTLGKLAEHGSVLASRYQKFAEDFEYFAIRKQLPSPPSVEAINARGEDKAYYTKYADMLRDPIHNSVLRTLGRTAVLDIREELGMTHLPSQLTDSEYFTKYPMPPEQ